jgi:uncharacterized protein YndB with AHSA1/START domain
LIGPAGTTLAEVSEVTVEEQIAASPETLYGLVSDVTRMGEWSPETTGCRWLGKADGPAVGARFRGANKDGWRRWSTTCTVVEAEPGRRFAFDVSLGPAPVSRWTYTFTPAGDGCIVTESWRDRRHTWMVRLSPFVMGVPDREDHNRQGMIATLERLKKIAES